MPVKSDLTAFVQAVVRPLELELPESDELAESPPQAGHRQVLSDSPCSLQPAFIRGVISD